MDGFDWRGDKSLKGWKTREFCKDSAPLKVKSKINLALKGLRGVTDLEVKFSEVVIRDFLGGTRQGMDGQDWKSDFYRNKKV